MVYMSILTLSMAQATLFIAEWAMPEDHLGAVRYNHPERRHAFLMGRSALRALLDRLTQKRGWEIAHHPGGKPYLVAADGAICPAISVSHTQGMIACAASFDGEVGIDVESWRLRDFTSLAEYAFSPNERTMVARDGSAAFYRIWTLKEALAKAQGKSIFNMLNTETDSGQPATPEVWQSSEWSYFSTTPAEGYSLSCITSIRPLADKNQFTFIRLK